MNHDPQRPLYPRKAIIFGENTPVSNQVVHLAGVEGAKTADRITRARAYMRSMPAAVSGSNGSGATLAVARVLSHGFALDDAETMTVLREYNLRCKPEWEECDLLHKLDSVKQYPYRMARGYLYRGSTPKLPIHDSQVLRPPAAKVRIRKIVIVEGRTGP